MNWTKQDAIKKLRWGGALGLFLTAICLAGGVGNSANLYWWSGAITFGVLTYGIYRKSRVAAVLLFSYIGLAVIRTDALGLMSLFMFFVLLYPALQGVRGTFAYHKLDVPT